MDCNNHEQKNKKIIIQLLLITKSEEDNLQNIKKILKTNKEYKHNFKIRIYISERDKLLFEPIKYLHIKSIETNIPSFHTEIIFFYTVEPTSMLVLLWAVALYKSLRSVALAQIFCLIVSLLNSNATSDCQEVMKKTTQTETKQNKRNAVLIFKEIRKFNNICLKKFIA